MVGVLKNLINNHKINVFRTLQLSSNMVLMNSCPKNIYQIEYGFMCSKQKKSTEGCSKFKSPESRQVQERLVSTLEHMQVILELILKFYKTVFELLSNILT